MNSLTIHGVGFNTDAFIKMSNKDFVSHPSRQAMWPELSEADRNDRLARAWHHLTGIPETIEKPGEDPEQDKE